MAVVDVSVVPGVVPSGSLLIYSKVETVVDVGVIPSGSLLICLF